MAWDWPRPGESRRRSPGELFRPAHQRAGDLEPCPAGGQLLDALQERVPLRQGQDGGAIGRRGDFGSDLVVQGFHLVHARARDRDV